jgi:hypothetical protein
VDERLHNWILAWILARDIVGIGREVYYYDPDHYGTLPHDEVVRDELMGKGTVKMTKVKMRDLTLEERETAIMQSADDRGTWKIYTDDPVMIAKLERMGMPAVVRDDGIGREYLVEANQVSFRRKRVMSEDEKMKRRERAKAAFGHGQPSKREDVEVCGECGGTGWKDGDTEGGVVCDECGGSGQHTG